MAKPKDLDELFDQLSDAFEMVKQDPRRMNQVKEMSNAAGKMVGIAKIKVMVAALKGEEPDFEMLGKFGGKPLKPNSKLLSE